MFIVERDKHNPILSPRADHDWESAGTFNWCPVGDQTGRARSVLYRAQSPNHLEDGIHRSVSMIGLAEAKDGIHFETRRQFIKPEHEWERFGCEDPRVTTIGKTHYIFYTALSTYPFEAKGIRVALAKADEKMNIIEKHLVTPFNAKAMALFPKKINGKLAALVTVHTDQPPAEICYVEFDRESDMWSQEFWDRWSADINSHRLTLRRGEHEQVELGSAPIRTPKGWLIIYSHIQNYGQSNATFGIEAALLDLEDPRKIIAATKGAFMVAEEYYERIGVVPNIIFPSGAHVNGNTLEIYYGATDTHCALARVNLKKFLDVLLGSKEVMKRHPGNPILSPRPGVDFEDRGVFNPAAVDISGTVHLLYRAVSKDNISTFGYATSKNGTTVDKRLNTPVYTPRADFERQGCEDPRMVPIGDRVSVFYTAYDGSVPRVAYTSIAAKDLAQERWQWEAPRIVTASNIADKDACILPEKINGKYMFIHRMDSVICADFIDPKEWENSTWEQAPVRSCIPLIYPRPGMWDTARVGMACPPIKTDRGWLMFYHGISNTTHYRVGAVLLDLEDPTLVLARSALPLFEPAEEYEWKGIVPGVVFPCGIVQRGNNLFLYYGAADLVVGVVTAKLTDILASLSI